MPDLSVPWNPHFAPAVTGMHEPRAFDPTTRTFDPQRFRVVCVSCGDTFEGVCDSGRIRQKIDKWAVMHLHRDNEPIG